MSRPSDLAGALRVPVRSRGRLPLRGGGRGFGFRLRLPRDGRRGLAFEFLFGLAVDAGGDVPGFHGIPHGFVQDDAEVELGEAGGLANQRAGVVDFVEAEAAAAGDIDKDGGRDARVAAAEG